MLSPRLLGIAQPRARDLPFFRCSSYLYDRPPRVAIGVPVGRARTFFGIGEVLGILANPGETLRSLADSKRLLEETRAEMLEQKERASIPPKHTFSPLPGFYHREREIKVLETCLSSVPNFTVLFGGTSVGKTALLRQVLTNDRYHVIHFDLRIAGFADLASLFFSLSCQIEQYFVNLSSRLEGYDQFEKEALAFKHLRLDIERRVEKNGTGLGVKTSDIAHLLELFQSCLLKYWEFTPKHPEAAEDDSGGDKPMKEWEKHKAEKLKHKFIKFHDPRKEEEEPELKGLEDYRSVKLGEDNDPPADTSSGRESEGQEGEGEQEKWKPPKKVVPVFFLDEAHKLPMLIKDDEAMKCILDALIVLTKQDRLCHVLHATSDPFYMYWLRDMNVLAHCTIITIGDPSKQEAREYFNENLIGTLKTKLDQQPIYDTRNGEPGELKLKREQKASEAPRDDYELDFDIVYETFGGKLAHLQAFVGDYLNSGGKLKPDQSSQFLQAYALLHYNLVNTDQMAQLNLSRTSSYHQTTPTKLKPVSPPDALANPHQAGMKHPTMGQPPTMTDSGIYQQQAILFKPEDLLYVMSKFTSYDADGTDTGASRTRVQGEKPRRSAAASDKSSQREYSYFKLCREIGLGAVEQMIKNRILDLRWTAPVTLEGEILEGSDSEQTIDPVVLPASPVMRRAMERVFEEQMAEDGLVKLPN